MLCLKDNPPTLYPPDLSLGDCGTPWWVAHTKSRAEKAFAHDLLAREIPYFLPLYRRTLYSGGRRRTVLHPLFSGYVFFSGDDRARYNALATDKLCQVIPVVDQHQLITELSAILLAIRAEIPLQPLATALCGRRCRVRPGHRLGGIEGIAMISDGVPRFVIRVGILGQAAYPEIEPDWLELIE